MPYDFNNPEYWFERADEMRTRADQMQDLTNREIMLRIADDYERLGNRTHQFQEERQQQAKRSG